MIEKENSRFNRAVNWLRKKWAKVRGGGRQEETTDEISDDFPTNPALREMMAAEERMNARVAELSQLLDVHMDEWDRRIGELLAQGDAIYEVIETEAAKMREEDQKSNPSPTRYSRVCPICDVVNPSQRAVYSECGHTVCYPCAVAKNDEENSRMADSEKQCSICRKPTGFVKLFEDEQKDVNDEKKDGQSVVEEGEELRSTDEKISAVAVVKEEESNPSPTRYSRACLICDIVNPAQRAVYVECGHIVCFPCAVDIAKEEGVGKCPSCRSIGFVKLQEDEQKDVNDEKK